jgi:phosphoribosylanthranilate isomerase
MQIKICGIKLVEEAIAAVEAGATHLGFNFYPKSPRYITPNVCVKIISALGPPHSAPITLVGLFVNEAPATVAALLDECGLDLAQIHSDDTPEQLSPLRGRFYKAFRGTADGAHHRAFAELSPARPALLVDAHVPGAYGGTGQLADWESARRLAGQYPIFLAGGLTPENVAAALAHVQPWGIDVASGVESAPGKKDHAKMRAFIANAQQASDTVTS